MVGAHEGWHLRPLIVRYLYCMCMYAYIFIAVHALSCRYIDRDVFMNYPYMARIRSDICVHSSYFTCLYLYTCIHIFIFVRALSHRYIGRDIYINHACLVLMRGGICVHSSCVICTVCACMCIYLQLYACEAVDIYIEMYLWFVYSWRSRGATHGEDQT